MVAGVAMPEERDDRLRPWRLLVIVAAGAVLGLAWNQLSGHGFALAGNVYVKPGDEVVEPPAARERQARGALLLDARGTMFYEFGHIPGALSLPEEDFEAAFARLEPQLRRSLDVIVYCSGFGCEASHIVARKLKEKGVPAAVLNEGFPAWQEAGYPVKQGRQP